MAGISSRAAGITPNKDKTFQGQKFDDDLGINYDEFKWRNDDPQIGRFIEIDPLADDYVYNSTYAFSENKVTTHVELEGLEAEWFERQVERDLNDVSSGKINLDQLQQRVDARNAIGSTALTKVVLPVVAAVLAPELVGAIRTYKMLRSAVEEETPTSENGLSTPKVEKTHGNKLDDKPAEGYTLKDKETGQTQKYGETTRGEEKFGPGRQKRYSQKELDKNNSEYNKETNGTKKEMHQWQHRKILQHKELNNGKRPPLNKSDY